VRCVVHVTFPPHWEHIDPLRDFIVQHARLRLGDELSERIQTVAQELIENAIKYGDPSEEPEITLSVDSLGHFELATKNRAVGSRISLLKQAFASARNPRDDLVTAMKRAPTLPPSQVMLGLPRIRSEADVHLEMDVVGDVVRIIARGGLR
jgi:hypothetical protein